MEITEVHIRTIIPRGIPIRSPGALLPLDLSQELYLGTDTLRAWARLINIGTTTLTVGGDLLLRVLLREQES